MNSLNKKINLLMVVLFFAFNLNAQDHDGDFEATGALKSHSGSLLLANHSLTTNNIGSIKYTSNHANQSSIILETNDNEELGSVMGWNASFGLRDKDGDWFINTVSDQYATINIDNNETMRLFADGKVKIGDVDIATVNDYKLYVEDGILSESLRVAVDGEADWADYVFEDKFELMPLVDVKDFIDKNHHLPNVPSANEMVLKGLDVLESDAILLRKIEEAYLYILEQQEQMEKQQKQLDELNKEVANLKNQNNEH